MNYKRVRRRTPAPRGFGCVVTLAISMACASGCGTTHSRGATEQLLASGAVDRAVSKLDFTVLSGMKVYLDTRYVKNLQGVGFANAEYIISSIRQQMAAAHCLLEDEPTDADYIVEARVGAIGLDYHNTIYGIPANNALGAATALIPTLPRLPSMPEISLAKKDHQLAAAKIGLFAYDRVTKEPLWQSGISQAKSTSKNTWLLGVGPIQKGTLYGDTQFAGSRIELPLLERDQPVTQRPTIAYEEEFYFANRAAPPTDPIAKSPGKTDASEPRRLEAESVQQAVHIENSKQ